MKYGQEIVDISTVHLIFLNKKQQLHEVRIGLDMLAREPLATRFDNYSISLVHDPVNQA